MKQFILLILLLPFSSVLAEQTLPKSIIPLDGRSAPSLVLSDMEGESYQLTQSKGRWVFLHFWASWCGPCRREMPAIQNIQAQFDNSHLDIVLVNTAESDDLVFNFLGIVAPDLGTLMDRDGLVTERWQPRGLPATFFIDPKGKLRFLALGGREWHQPEYIHFLQNLKKIP